MASVAAGLPLLGRLELRLQDSVRLAVPSAGDSEVVLETSTLRSLVDVLGDICQRDVGVAACQKALRQRKARFGARVGGQGGQSSSCSINAVAIMLQHLGVHVDADSWGALVGRLRARRVAKATAAASLPVLVVESDSEGEARPAATSSGCGTRRSPAAEGQLVGGVQHEEGGQADELGGPGGESGASDGDDYEAMDRSKLVRLLRRRDKQISVLKRKLKSAQQVRRRASRLAGRHAASRELGQADPRPSLNIDKVGNSNRLTLAGSLSLAIRRNIGTCSARSLGPVLLESVHHSTISGAEIRAAAALLAAGRRFHSQLFEETVEQQGGTPQDVGEDVYPVNWHVAVTAFRGDATNSAVCLGSKVHNLEVETVRVADPGPERAWALRQPGSWWGRHRQLADLQVVADATAAGTHAIVTKQLRSLAVPL
jgi:hypothetical protein